jgi:hypothetical protein
MTAILFAFAVHFDSLQNSFRLIAKEKGNNEKDSKTESKYYELAEREENK